MRKLLIIAGCLLSSTAFGHQAPTGWSYDGYCCSGTDCDQIPTEAVKIIEGGYQITLKPGDHPMVTRVHVFQVEQIKTRQSKDEFYHVCLWPNEDTIRCVYAPVLGY